MDTQQAKSIIAHFLKNNIDDINETTVMDYTVVPSSLLLHRMYAALADKGYVVGDPASIVTYGDFLRSVQSSDNINQTYISEQLTTNTTTESDNALIIGIDIEEISSFDITDDYANHQFYKSNFSLEEIQYCITKPDPVQSFAGMFSVKEAIVKADNSFKKIEFNKLKIIHTATNIPMFKGFSLSISHSKKHVVAVACKIHNQKNKSLPEREIKQLVAREVKDTVRTLMVIGVSALLFFVVIIYSFIL